MTTNVAEFQTAYARRIEATVQALQDLAGLTDSEMMRRTGIKRTTYQAKLDPRLSQTFTGPELQVIAEALSVDVGLLYLAREDAVASAVADGFLERHDPDGITSS